MANTYIITSAIQNPATDTLTVTGSVNGVPVVVNTWLTAAGPGALASAVGFQNFISPLMLAAYNAITNPTPIAAVPANGLTFTK